MTGAPRIGLLGGTFDPVHHGHVDIALAARRALSLARVWLLPSRVPPHKTASTSVSGHHRFAMVALGIRDQPALRISDLEVESSPPSFTSLTLQALARSGHHPSRLFFIIGTDAFADVTHWHDYPAVLDRSHFVVVSRPGLGTDGLRTRLPSLAARMRTVSSGPPGRPDADGTPAIWLVDATTRDVSSSMVRTRLARGDAVDDLVPPDVSAYITSHRLYMESSPGGPFA